MKVVIETIRVEAYRSGPRKGEFKPFDLPEGAQIIDSRTYEIGGRSTMVVKIARPA